MRLTATKKKITQLLNTFPTPVPDLTLPSRKTHSINIKISCTTPQYIWFFLLSASRLTSHKQIQSDIIATKTGLSIHRSREFVRHFFYARLHPHFLSLSSRLAARKSISPPFFYHHRRARCFVVRGACFSSEKIAQNYSTWTKFVFFFLWTHASPPQLETDACFYRREAISQCFNYVGQ